MGTALLVILLSIVAIFLGVVIFQSARDDEIKTRNLKLEEEKEELETKIRDLEKENYQLSKEVQGSIVNAEKEINKQIGPRWSLGGIILNQNNQTRVFSYKSGKIEEKFSYSHFMEERSKDEITFMKARHNITNQLPYDNSLWALDGIIINTNAGKRAFGIDKEGNVVREYVLQKGYKTTWGYASPITQPTYTNEPIEANEPQEVPPAKEQSFSDLLEKNHSEPQRMEPNLAKEQSLNDLLEKNHTGNPLKSAAPIPSVPQQDKKHSKYELPDL